jgi:ATP-dependent helicase/nuclease subunit B
VLQETVRNNATVIASSRRLARALKERYGEEQLAAGRTAWRTPDVQFLDDWLAQVLDNAAGRQPVVLGAHASAVVWETSLRRYTDDELLNAGALVRQARQAWLRLNDWLVPLAEVSAAACSQDEQLFANAAREYHAILRERDWVDAAQLTGIVSGLVESKAVVVPARILHAGFDRLVPAVEHLFGALARAGCRVSAIDRDDSSAFVQVASFGDAESELRAAGCWARRNLEDNADASIAIISPALDRNAARIERLVREGVAPGWQYGEETLRSAVNTSYGKRLSQYPAVAVALLLLQWAHRDLSFEEISILLRTPFMAGQETAGRSRLELHLRRMPDQSWTPARIVRFLQRRAPETDASKWLEAVTHVDSFRREAVGKISPAAWADRIDGLFKSLGWPGSRTLASDEFQLLNRWRELLNEFARLELVIPAMSVVEVSRRLGMLASETLYQPESRTPVVQLLGLLEASGLHFDGVWVSGLDADTWPPTSHPLTLVSRQLQREYAMPDATPDDTLEYSKRVLHRLIGSAERVILSWPESTEGSENSASPLIAVLPPAAEELTRDPGWHAKHFLGSHPVEVAIRDPVPAVLPDEKLGGGAYTIDRYMTEPFASFAYGRLQVSDIAGVETGLSAAQRGSLIHTALQALFAEKPSQAVIGEWSRTDRRGRISASVDAAIGNYARQADAVLRRVLALERDRLCALLEDLVDAELKRLPFTIQSVEHEIDYEYAGVRLELRIDRIDRLSDDTQLIVDYKTGQQKRLLNRSGDPLDFQLVVYSSAIDHDVGGLLLINVDSRSIHYSGASASGEWDARRADQWASRLTAWQGRVASAIEQIARGDVRINLSPPDDRARKLRILSRFQECVRA